MTINGYEYLFKGSADIAASPTLLLLHGTGGDEHDLIPLARTIRPSANVLSPRGNVPENGMNRFFRRLAEGIFDQKDLRLRTEALGSFIERASEQHGFDPAIVCAIGYSNGANIAASLLLREPQRLCGAILLHAMPPFIPDGLPDLDRKPLFLSAGRHDPIVAPESAEQLRQLFVSANAEVTLYQHDAGHGITADEVFAAQAWMHEHFPP